MSRAIADVRSFLHLLRTEPTLMPWAPAGDPAVLISRRTHDEVHSCLRCGQCAQVAYVAATVLGPRWLDLCAACDHWFRCGMDVVAREDEAERLESALGILDGWKP
jgi:hypothetical protein